MGAFVGNVTSPFLRRRKGRIGRDVIGPLTAPAYGGANLFSSAGNDQISVCSLSGVNNTYQKGNFGQSAWISKTLLDPNMRIGSGAASADSNIKMRPFNANMDLDTWHLQNHFSAAGIHVTIGGALYQISPDGNSNKQNFQVAGTPMEAVAWSNDGRCYFTAGQMAGGAVVGRGNISDDTADAPQTFNYSLPTVGLGCVALMAYEESVYRHRYAFISFNLPGSGSAVIKQIFRRIRENDWVNGNDLFSPLLLAQCGHFMQIQDKLMAFDATNPNMIFAFLSNLAAWTSVAVGTGSGIHGAIRYGKRIYVISNIAPKIRMSRNAGVTWETITAQPPDAGAALDSIFTDAITGDIFMLGHDGVVNRLYKFRPYLEI